LVRFAVLTVVRPGLNTLCLEQITDNNVAVSFNLV